MMRARGKLYQFKARFKPAIRKTRWKTQIMLEALRKGTGSWLAKIFIGLLVLSFAVWGIADIFGGYGKQTVATVGETEIPAQAYQTEFQRELRNFSNRLGRQFTTDEARSLGLDRQVLIRMIGDAALQSQARKLGVDVSGNAVVAWVRREPAFRDSSGKFSQQRFYQILLSNGLSEQGFLERQRQSLVQEQITSTVTQGSRVPDTLLEAANRFRNEKRTLRYVTVPLEKAGDIGEPTEAQLRDYYNSHKSEFRAPEYREVGLIVVTPDELAKSIEISEDDVKTYFEQNKAQFGSPEKRSVMQIPFPDEESANEAYEKLKNGADFMEIAKTRDLTEKDVDLGLVTKSEILDETVADAVFDLPVGEVSEPIKGQLATVIAKVTKVEPAVVKTLDDERDKIRKALAAERAADQILDTYDKIEDERAAGLTLAEIAEKLNLKYVDIKAVDQRGRDAGGNAIDMLDRQPKVLRAIFSADAGVETDPVETAENGFVWYQVREVTPARQKEFDEARDEIEEKWREAEEREILAKKGQELIDRLKGGETLDAVAEDMELEVKESSSLKRTARADDLPNAAIQQAFALEEGAFGSAATDDGKGRVVFKIDKVELPGSLDAKTRKELAKSIESQIGDDLTVQYIRALREAFGVNINQAVFEEAVTGRRPAS